MKEAEPSVFSFLCDKSSLNNRCNNIFFFLRLGNKSGKKSVRCFSVVECEIPSLFIEHLLCVQYCGCKNAVLLGTHSDKLIVKTHLKLGTQVVAAHRHEYTKCY